jgi:hypothetical protein
MEAKNYKQKKKKWEGLVFLVSSIYGTQLAVALGVAVLTLEELRKNEAQPEKPAVSGVAKADPAATSD